MATFPSKWSLRKRGRAARQSPPIPRAALGRRAPAGPWARVPRAGRFPSCPGRSRRPDTQGRPLLPPGRSPATRERRAGAALTAAPAGCVQLGLRCLCLSLPRWQGRPLNPHVGHGPRAAGWPSAPPPVAPPASRAPPRLGRATARKRKSAWCGGELSSHRPRDCWAPGAAGPAWAAGAAAQRAPASEMLSFPRPP